MTEEEKARFVSGYVRKRGTGPLGNSAETEVTVVASYRLAHNPINGFSHTLATIEIMSNNRAYMVHRCYKQECRHDRENGTHTIEIPISLVEYWCEVGAIERVLPFCRN